MWPSSTHALDTLPPSSSIVFFAIPTLYMKDYDLGLCARLASRTLEHPLRLLLPRPPPSPSRPPPTPHAYYLFDDDEHPTKQRRRRNVCDDLDDHGAKVYSRISRPQSLKKVAREAVFMPRESRALSPGTSTCSRHVPDAPRTVTSDRRSTRRAFIKRFALRHAITAPPSFKFWISRSREVVFALPTPTPAHVNFGFGLPASAVTSPLTRHAAVFLLWIWCSRDQVRAKLAFAPPPSGQQRASTFHLPSPQATFALPPAATAPSHHDRACQHLHSGFRVPATEIAFVPRPRHFNFFNLGFPQYFHFGLHSPRANIAFASRQRANTTPATIVNQDLNKLRRGPT
ncbi:hypothetical protein DFH09DRAFT_1345631 [Mycena vulgaris]|nr:hypothetical protein DFH09DRAFT_1345631 [Mycena vulgaris]